MTALYPFLILLVAALIVNYIPMEPVFKSIINIIIGIVALVMVLNFVNFM